MSTDPLAEAATGAEVTLDPLGRAGRAPPAGVLGSILGVLPGELRRTLVLATYLFVASSIFVLGRTTRDAIFLSSYRDRATVLLPYMFIAYGAASAAVAAGYARLADATRRDRFVVGFTLVGAASYAAVWLLLKRPAPWLPAVFYVWAEIVGNLVLVQFWSVANDLHDARSARRLFGVIGVGRTLGVLACGLGASGAVHDLGTDNLLLVIVALMAVVVGLVRVLVGEHGLASAQKQLTPRGPRPASLGSPYVRALALMILLGFVAVNVGDFQFKAAARLVHPHRDDLARFMSLYYATLGAVALPVQLVLTPRLLRRFGVLGGALALPLGYFAANLLFLALPTIQTATILKISDNALQFTIFDATLQLLYFPLPPDTRGPVRNLLEVVAKPAGYALAGVLVIALRAVGAPDTLRGIALQSALVVPLVVVWLALVPRVHDRYLDALRRSLARRDTDPFLIPESDASTVAVLERALGDESPRVVCYALDQLRAADPGAARAALGPLLDHPATMVRAAALAAAGRLGAAEFGAQVRRHLDDPAEAVAAAAIFALGALDGEDAMPTLGPLALSRRRGVQDAALGAMLVHGGLEGVLAAGRMIETWLASAEPDDRRRAAELFAHPGIPGLSRVVRRLLVDHDASVRRAALGAAGAARDPKTIGAVLAALPDPSCQKAAVRALAAIGDAAVPGAARALASLATARPVRLALPRALQLIGSRAAYDALLAQVAPEDDEWVRQKVLAAASRVRARQGYDGVAPRAAAALMARELDGYARLRDGYGQVRAALAMPLVDSWVLDRLRKTLVRVMRLAELSAPHARAAAARDQLFAADPGRRAAALEMCENLLAVGVRARFARLVDDLVALRATPLPPLRPGRVPAAAPLALELVQAPDAFARVVGLDVVQFRAADVPFELVFRLLRDSSPAVREMAALTLARRRPRGWREALVDLTGDPDARVREYAEYVVATGLTGMDEDDGMYTTLEKLLYLQRIELFAEVPPEHLLALARSASVEPRAAGEVVFARGDAGDALYFIIDGRVGVGAPGREAADFAGGDVFGEMSVLDSAPRAATATVVEGATLLRIAREDFYEVLHGTTELAEGVIHVLVRRLREATSGGWDTVAGEMTGWGSSREGRRGGGVRGLKATAPRRFAQAPEGAPTGVAFPSGRSPRRGLTRTAWVPWLSSRGHPHHAAEPRGLPQPFSSPATRY